jgi:hypothetical protein
VKTRQMLAGAAAGLAMLAGCGSTNETPPPSTSPTSATTTTSAQAGPAVANNLRGKRYCEVLLVRVTNGSGVADVYNSYPLNACAPNLWSKLDTGAIAKQERFPIAILNGPRYWLMDTIEKSGATDDLHKAFGGIEMIRRATVEVGPLAEATKPYTVHRVNRKTVFEFDAGRTVFELTAADGKKYVMQSWSRQTDPELDEAGLATLGPRLRLPAGWTYNARRLTAPLRVVTTETDARVLQDDFRNSYSLVTGG